MPQKQSTIWFTLFKFIYHFSPKCTLQEYVEPYISFSCLWHFKSSCLWTFFILPEISFLQFSSVTRSCLTLCDPRDCSTPGLSVQHQLPELTQTHVHRVGDAIQSSHPLSSPFSSHLQSFPASGSFQMSQFFTSGGQSVRVSASASVLPMSIQDWFPLGIFRTNFLSLHLSGKFLLIF